MTSNEFDRQRLKDLEDNLAKERDLLKQFEDTLRYETDPRIKARYQNDIERQKKMIIQYQQEYQELKSKLSGDLPIQTSDVPKRNSSTNPNNPQQSIFSGVNVGGSINIHGSINQLNNSEKMVQNNSASSTIKIFLASSSELKEEREQFEIFIYRKCQ